MFQTTRVTTDVVVVVACVDGLEKEKKRLGLIRH
jgi:hypothetical protein